jgi:hypothetical protein
MEGRKERKKQRKKEIVNNAETVIKVVNFSHWQRQPFTTN